MLPGYEFELCLTHDVDRPYKGLQAPYYAFSKRDFRHLKGLLPGVNPWWQFEEIMELEESLGVRSAFYFLQEESIFQKPPNEWLTPRYWIEHLGRYDLFDTDILDVLHELDDGGWEIGLHGSYDSYDNPDALREQKTALEAALGHRIRGGRQHHLNRAESTWDHHREIGLSYDATLGSSSEYGFQHGYEAKRPFDDDFLVFPLTMMDIAVADPGTAFDDAWETCEQLLDEAAENDAVMTILWHPRMFADEFPGHRRLYRKFIEGALERGAWVGPPGDLCDRLSPVTQKPTGTANLR
ncbi:polysaccharide deacetylase family protein [Haladaptatus pallidirubidus]|uniref:Polysaccharide deacetylase family protein n=1 Tax=Haladaptatus pallidirubidus TaxID=1008152 RepID=A0AAV3UEU3_9EURY|nr:polysaccharide deacetylase family protein [Haladaptatus pallidirubidus]